MTQQALGELQRSTLAEIASDRADGTAKLVRRMKREQDAHASACARGDVLAEPVFDVLVISGGGDWGAFGAGVLEGWGEVTGERARPVFDGVTGVSAGAIIAPFAFLGAQADHHRIVEHFRNPKPDWAVFRGALYFLPWRESFATTDGFRRDLESWLDPETIARIAAQGQLDRSLIIGTTNLDLGRNRPFALEELCQRAAKDGSYARVYDVLMASGAVPAAFPPQLIGECLHVDGATTANILPVVNLRASHALVGAWRRTYPERKMSKIRIWVLINNQMMGVAKLVARTWPAITSEALATMIRFANMASIRQLDYQMELMREVDGLDAEYLYLAVPNDFRVPVEGLFEKQTMCALAELGQAMGRDPRSWLTRPDFE